MTDREICEKLVSDYFALGVRLFHFTPAGPTVVWDLNGLTAGTAQKSTGLIRLNPSMLHEQGLALFLPTIGHEVAHLFAPHGAHHGSEWQKVMRAFALPVQRTHNMPRPQAKLGQKVVGLQL